MSGEILAMRVNTVHNLTYYQRLMQNIRMEIENGRFEEFAAEFCKT
jgi:queuine tRNA-ribosyltransferase